MSIRDKRHRAACNALERAYAQRDAAIAMLVRSSQKIKMLTRQCERYVRLADKAKAEPAPVKAGLIAPAPATAPSGNSAEMPDVPEFLQRSSKARERDAVEAAAFQAEIDERKRRKSIGRTARKKAEAAGDTKKMPLTGKAALDFINRD